MGLLGISLILASVVYFVARPPSWLRSSWPRRLLGGLAARDAPAVSAAKSHEKRLSDDALRIPDANPRPPSDAEAKMPQQSSKSPVTAVPSIVAADHDDPGQPSTVPPPLVQAPLAQKSSQRLAVASSTVAMPPPSLPSRRVPRLAPSTNPAGRSSRPSPARSLAPAPTPTPAAKPAKPSRKVILEPGHSPLDWARLAGPHADLRGLPPATPYLRVPPSLLKTRNGRAGADAWMALQGRVYNVTPYAAFHPGGVPELMRAAGKDGSRLFGEVHPWVNFETMLASCLVGLLVDESDAQALHGDMDKMD